MDSQSDGEDDETTADVWRDRDAVLLFEDEDGFEGDIGLMEGLFDDDKKRYRRMLACLDNHTSPVNCVRWNNVGTHFASAADDGCIFLWEYVGEMVQSGLQKY